MKRTLAAALTATVVLVTVPASGADDAIAGAEAAFTRGLTLAEAGSWAQARAEFERAGAVRMTPQIRFQIARCNAKLGRMVEALGGMRLAVQQAATTNDEVLRARLDEELRKLDARVPRVILRVEKPDARDRITIDDFEVAPVDVGRPVPADPGVRTVRVHRGDAVVFEKTIELREGSTQALVVPATVETTEPVADEGSSRWTTPVVASGVAGVVLLGASAVFFVLRQNAIAELDRSCSADRVCDRSFEHVADEGRTSSALSIGFGAAGLVALGTAVYLFARDGGKTSRADALVAPPFLRF